MTGITGDQLLTFLVVAVALVGVYNAVMAAINNHEDREKKKAGPLEDVKRMLGNDKARLDNHESAIKDLRTDVNALGSRTDQQDDEMRLLLKSQLALLRHGIDGNNTQGLKDSQKDIQDYLVDK